MKLKPYSFDSSTSVLEYINQKIPKLIYLQYLHFLPIVKQTNPQTYLFTIFTYLQYLQTCPKLLICFFESI